MSAVYTVCFVDKNNIPHLYLTPNYLDPAQALERMRDEKRKHPMDTVKVLRLNHDILDEAELLHETEQARNAVK